MEEKMFSIAREKGDSLVRSARAKGKNLE